MANQNKMSVFDFGKELVRTRDLDPVYVLLYEAYQAVVGGRIPVFTGYTLDQFLLAYWCFYHCGTASWIVDQKDYWKAMETAAGSKDYPRNSERRHYRGAQAKKSIAWLKNMSVPSLFYKLRAKHSRTAHEVMDYVQTWVGFGPWIAFKVADMVDRLGLGASVTFDKASALMFDSPRKGAELMWSVKYGTKPMPTNVTGWASTGILLELNPTPSPPRYERNLNVQESETILCKWKSYMGGHYHIGEDIASLKKGLEKFDTPTAEALLGVGLECKLW